MSVRQIATTALFIALLSIGSMIYLPIGPIPYTLQTFFVFLAGILLGKKWGTIAIAVWILLGLIGIPVFSQGRAGVMILLSPTSGFLIGFLAASFTMGWYLEKKKNVFSNALVSIFIGLFWIYLFGGVGFYLHSIWVIHNPYSWQEIFQYAIAPFILVDLAKGVLAALVGVKMRSIFHIAGVYPI
ncbi:MAG TPA: biotin transporter BioY [Caldisericia bacterium]|mgnify:FL=1|jgi:biotin transport system substrate-specific component|nr:biotin transporter BioY [Caldisericia bacterium]